jgi:hypothetical protein
MTDTTPPTYVPIVAALSVALSALPGNGYRSVTASYQLPVEVAGWDEEDARVTLTVSIGDSE